MHDVDRTQLEAYEAEDEFGELEQQESEEFLGALIGPATQIIGGLLGGQELEAPFSEMETTELASELLEVQSEEELEQFLGDIVKQAASAVGSFVRSDTGRALTGVAKDVAKKALPGLGQAVGGYFGGPTGAQLGGQLASAAGSLFGLELEGLSAQEAELEAAKGVVRMTGAAAKVAARAPRNAPARQVARTATQAAAQRYAPGLVTGRRGGPQRPTGAGPSSPTRRRRRPRPGHPGQVPGQAPSRPAPSGPAQIAVASGLPTWVVQDVGPRGRVPVEEPYGYEPGYDEDYEPSYGNGYEPGFDQPVRTSRNSGRWVRRRGQIVLLGV